MRKARNMPIDKTRFSMALKQHGLRQVDAEKRLNLEFGTIAGIKYHGSANPMIIEMLEKELHIKYDDIRPVDDKIVMPESNCLKLTSVKANDTEGIAKTEIPKPEPRPLVSVQVNADVIAEAVKEGMKQFWQECKNDILKAFEDVIFTGNYDARRKYTSQDLTYDLHKCWNTDKGYADLPEVQATLHRKR